MMQRINSKPCPPVHCVTPPPSACARRAGQVAAHQTAPPAPHPGGCRAPLLAAAAKGEVIWEQCCLATVNHLEQWCPTAHHESSRLGQPACGPSTAKHTTAKYQTITSTPPTPKPPCLPTVRPLFQHCKQLGGCHAAAHCSRAVCRDVQVARQLQGENASIDGMAFQNQVPDSRMLSRPPAPSAHRP